MRNFELFDLRKLFAWLRSTWLFAPFEEPGRPRPKSPRGKPKPESLKCRLLISLLLIYGFGVLSPPDWKPLTLENIHDRIANLTESHGLAFRHVPEMDRFDHPALSMFDSIPTDQFLLLNDNGLGFYVLVSYLPEGSERFNPDMPEGWVDEQVVSVSLISVKAPTEPVEDQIFWFTIQFLLPDISQKLEEGWYGWDFSESLRSQFADKVQFTVYDVFVGMNDYDEFEVRVNVWQPKETQQKTGSGLGC